MQEDYFRKGKVSKYFPHAGYGFIRDGAGHETYFHLDEVRFVGEKKKRGEIKEGMEVGFDVSRTSRGIRATFLKIYPIVSASTPSGTGEPPAEKTPETELKASPENKSVEDQTPQAPAVESHPPDKK